MADNPMVDDAGLPDGAPITRSDRDPDELRRRFTAWLTATAGDGAEVHSCASPDTNGMSSETLLVAATLPGEGEVDLVVRAAPSDTAVPVFPHYFLDRQFETMRLVGSLSEAPVPKARWFEADPSALGAPFFVMDKVVGDVPPDVLPYNFGSWVTEATDEQRQRLEQTTIAALAAVHGIGDAATRFSFLVPDADRTHTPLRHHFDAQRTYYDWCRQGQHIPVLDDMFDHLESTWPTNDPGWADAALSWGDSRVGNVMYRDFAPVAVLDWEMASIAPREVDVAWLIFLHRFFEDIAHLMELAGLPTFLGRAQVEAEYAERSGHTPSDMEWYLSYAALRHGVVMMRVAHRQIHFGEREPADDPDDLVMHASTLRAMMAGEYWPAIAGT